MSLIPIDEVVYFDIVTSNPTTGAAVDADSTPTFDVYEEATDTGLLGATNFTKRTSLTGNYRGTFTASAANGFEAGKWYSVIASATVASVAAKAAVKNFRCCPAEAAAGVPKVDVDTIKTNPVVNAGTVTFPTTATLASTTNITAASGVALSAAGITAIWAEVITGTTTAVGAMRGFIAAMLGKASGLDTLAPKYRNIADTKNVISATTDADGNRTAVTLDLT